MMFLAATLAVLLTTFGPVVPATASLPINFAIQVFVGFTLIPARITAEDVIRDNIVGRTNFVSNVIHDLRATERRGMDAEEKTRAFAQFNRTAKAFLCSVLHIRDGETVDFTYHHPVNSTVIRMAYTRSFVGISYYGDANTYLEVDAINSQEAAVRVPVGKFLVRTHRSPPNMVAYVIGPGRALLLSTRAVSSRGDHPDRPPVLSLIVLPGSPRVPLFENVSLRIEQAAMQPRCGYLLTSLCTPLRPASDNDRVVTDAVYGWPENDPNVIRTVFTKQGECILQLKWRAITEGDVHLTATQFFQAERALAFKEVTVQVVPPIRDN